MSRFAVFLSGVDPSSIYLRIQFPCQSDQEIIDEIIQDRQTNEQGKDDLNDYGEEE
jgi:hypothetical protein